jgi:hypothetical protein
MPQPFTNKISNALVRVPTNQEEVSIRVGFIRVIRVLFFNREMLNVN